MLLKSLIRIATLTAIALPAVTKPAAALEGSTCFNDWSDAAPIVARERLRAASDLQIQARTRFDRDLVRITLCQLDGNYVYRLLLRDANGRISPLTVDAHPSN